MKKTERLGSDVVFQNGRRRYVEKVRKVVYQPFIDRFC
jgi:hypothetical protein